jgi:Uma2 family endonuclease
MSLAVSPLSTDLTFEAYLTYSDGTDTRYELVNGDLVEMPPESEKITKSPEGSCLNWLNTSHYLS